MTSTTSTKVADVKVGAMIRSPFGHHTLTIVEIRDGMYGLIELIGTNDDGDRHLLSLDPDETVEEVPQLSCSGCGAGLGYYEEGTLDYCERCKEVAGCDVATRTAHYAAVRAAR